MSYYRQGIKFKIYVMVHELITGLSLRSTGRRSGQPMDWRGSIKN